MVLSVIYTCFPFDFTHVTIKTCRCVCARVTNTRAYVYALVFSLAARDRLRVQSSMSTNMTVWIERTKCQRPIVYLQYANIFTFLKIIAHKFYYFNTSNRFILMTKFYRFLPDFFLDIQQNNTKHSLYIFFCSVEHQWKVFIFCSLVLILRTHIWYNKYLSYSRIMIQAQSWNGYCIWVIFDFILAHAFITVLVVCFE